ncbi:hypothetical protein VTN77DRAFT_7528 [Rasamsonia byssochlamydoides]|uniref:uncharacterized protein n=1 Tax=Rasamsonia byssochlamydoides TaxID=89139 RepID=UPI00374309F5
MADDTDDSGGVILEGPFDPDAQATVTDFIDYTEYLPSDLIRSLTLIRGLDETYLEATQKVHELTKTYGQLPDLPPESRPNPQDLREQISIQLDRALNAREASYAEACRLYDVVDRHFDRLGCIKRKLESLPKPPSRDPTPPPAPASPENKRSRNGRKTEEGPTRITLRVDGQGGSRGTGPKSRSRRSVIAGEVFDPDSPIASTEQSDNEGGQKAHADRAVKAEKSPDVSAPKKEKQPKRARASRAPGTGTNARNSVAGISTSNALAMLKPPPEDAKIGSEDLPWLRLTEWEMTKLRKKMKKNAVWQPSEIMINRELARSGRGWEGYRAAKARAEATGEELIDCDDIMNNYIPGKLTRKSEANADTVGMEETKTSNRGMKLNEAKKLKRETLAREQAALAAAEAEMAAKRLGDIGSTFKSLFSTPVNGVAGLLGSSSRPNGTATKEKEKSKTPKKRKQEDTATSEAPPSTDANAPGASKPATKRRKLNKTTEATPSSETPSASSTTAPAPAPATAAATAVAPSTDASQSSPPTGSKSSTTQPSIPTITSGPAAAVAARKASKTPTPPSTRPPSRRRSAAASVEPSVAASTGTSREHLRRKSTTPAARTPAPEAPRSSSTAPTANRRRKRPAPGPVSSSQDGGAAVSYGRRKAKPTKKRASGNKESVAPKGEDYRIDEDGVLEEIDPNEPRYCLCGDVSFGTMICCENADCDKEWFHLECVGLSDVPSRTAKWYCPDCRVKFNKGPDGIVKVGSRR